MPTQIITTKIRQEFRNIIKYPAILQITQWSNFFLLLSSLFESPCTFWLAGVTPSAFQRKVPSLSYCPSSLCLSTWILWIASTWCCTIGYSVPCISWKTVVTPRSLIRLRFCWGWNTSSAACDSSQGHAHSSFPLWCRRPLMTIA